MKAWFEMTEEDHVPYEESDGGKDDYYLFCMRMLWNNYFKNYTQWQGYSEISRHDFLWNQHGLALLRNHPMFEKGFQLGKDMTMRIADRMNVTPPKCVVDFTLDDFKRILDFSKETDYTEIGIQYFPI